MACRDGSPSSVFENVRPRIKTYIGSNKCFMTARAGQCRSFFLRSALYREEETSPLGLRCILIRHHASLAAYFLFAPHTAKSINSLYGLRTVGEGGGCLLRKSKKSYPQPWCGYRNSLWHEPTGTGNIRTPVPHAQR